MSRIASCPSRREWRCRRRPRWFLVPLILFVPSGALAGEAALEDAHQTATVLSAGGERLTSGRLVGCSVLGEAFAARELLGANYAMGVGFLTKKLQAPVPGAVGEDAAAPVVASRLVGNSPNPFNPATTVRFDLGRPGPVALKIYDVRGRLVRKLVQGSLSAGEHRTSWNGRNDAGLAVASGVYFVEMLAGDYRAQRKMILAR